MVAPRPDNYREAGPFFSHIPPQTLIPIHRESNEAFMFCFKRQSMFRHNGSDQSMGTKKRVKSSAVSSSSDVYNPGLQKPQFELKVYLFAFLRVNGLESQVQLLKTFLTPCYLENEKSVYHNK